MLCWAEAAGAEWIAEPWSPQLDAPGFMICVLSVDAGCRQATIVKCTEHVEDLTEPNWPLVCNCQGGGRVISNTKSRADRADDLSWPA